MKNTLRVSLIFSVLFFSGNFSEAKVSTLEEYNKTFIDYGVAWKDRYPSVYLGFAPRVEIPNNIHLRVARGNNLRLTAVLDQNTILTYPYQLKKRYEVYGSLFAKKSLQVKNGNNIDNFFSLLQSEETGLFSLINNFENKTISERDFYLGSLALMKKLNPGRIFNIKIDLDKHLLSMKNSIQSFSGDDKKLLVLINDLLPGRINLVFVSPQIKSLFKELQSKNNDAEFLSSAIRVLNQASGNRYADHIENLSGSNLLNVHEFTAIYPIGTVKQLVSDGAGNQIPMIRTNGARWFLDNDKRDVDNVTAKKYYGWIPKMDYEFVGSLSNGIHNPAVHQYLKSSTHTWLYEKLNIPRDMSYLWTVSRGGVSHGCVRMQAGHIWEVRHVFPSDPKRLTAVRYFGNKSADYDVFDIDGDMKPEVMGVKYFIAYALAGSEGDARYTSDKLIEESFNRLAFYNVLYGAKGQFKVENDRLIFTNPSVSYFAASSEKGIGGVFSVSRFNEVPLYEQDFEKDKIQFYQKSAGGVDLEMVQALGRINGCGPFKSELCYEEEFNRSLGL